jgi:hypothetical protein
LHLALWDCWNVSGIQGSAPKTFPRNVWVKDLLSMVFGDKNNFASYSDQLDAFVELFGWPARTADEKGNKLVDTSKDAFLNGLTAVMELYYYGMPPETVRCSTLICAILNVTCRIA